MTRIMKALGAKREQLAKKDEGFTLIELLVVVIIIGILAAIAIPVYLGIQNSSKESSLQTDATNAKIAVIAYQTETGKLPTASDTNWQAAKYGYTKGDYSDAPVLSITTAGDGFCVQVSPAADSGITQTYAASDSSGAVKGTCAAGVLTKTP
jgi:type IV pilus assembly protein PilA